MQHAFSKYNKAHLLVITKNYQCLFFVLFIYVFFAGYGSAVGNLLPFQQKCDPMTGSESMVIRKKTFNFSLLFSFL